jgi:hypothetical protein
MTSTVVKLHTPTASCWLDSHNYQFFAQPQGVHREMRVLTACLQCRSRKQKCSRSDATGPCHQCNSRARKCSLEEQQPSRAPRTIYENKHPLPSTDVVECLVELYLCYIHDKPHSLFHCRSLQLAIQDGTCPKALVFSILALGARYLFNFVVAGL